MPLAERPHSREDPMMLWLTAIVFGGAAFGYVRLRRRRKAGAQ